MPKNLCSAKYFSIRILSGRPRVLNCIGAGAKSGNREVGLVATDKIGWQGNQLSGGLRDTHLAMGTISATIQNF